MRPTDTSEQAVYSARRLKVGRSLLGGGVATLAVLAVGSVSGCGAQTTDPPTDAAGVIDAFKAAKLPIRDSQVYTAENDPNELLGRPHGYTSKANFVDRRIDYDRATDPEPDLVDVDEGGSVEVFANAADAQQRRDYIDGLPTVLGGAEYKYLSGPVLVRVSQSLTPSEAHEYEEALP